MKVIKNYFYNSSYQIFLIILPIITLPYVSRILGPTYLGINSYTYSLTNYFVLFAVLGTTVYGQREIAYLRNNRRGRSVLFWELEFLNLLTTGISFLVLVMVIFGMPNYHIFMWAYSINVIANVFDVSWLFMGTERFSVLVIRNFFVKITSVVLIFTLVKSSDDLITYVLINSLSVLFSNLLLWPYLKELISFDVKVLLPDMHPFQHLRGTIALFVPQISITLYTVLNKIILGYMGKIREESYFDNSDKIVRLVFTVLTSLSTVLMPVVAGEISKGKSENVQKLLKLSLSFSLFIVFPLCFGLIALSSQLIPLFLGNQYRGAIILLQIQSVILIPMTIANVIGNQYLVPSRKSRQLNVSIITGSIFNILVSFPLIYYYGALGAAYAILMSESLVTVMQVIQVKGMLLFKGMGGDLVKAFMSALVMGLVVLLEQSLLSGWISIIFGIGLGVVVYACVLLMCRTRLVKYVVKEYKIRRKTFG
ncbi:oligosaccharide flippase family protein [Levilactobacillus namurensis]|uniref:oligosaccharide flippase family protein n=1 Tax=Levilactobacillus namurensis TaxID=380393 RepID=UPI002231647B|nr:oligosaccharide flippase family protein [Levilactobacillus namurensis]MCW3779556.1 oligosaccharide flippase family protein [Levilactobacillus namurensis]MDT7018150.1 oligosaccharide flippase family protein [Levilactobacillus namurensis]WNN64861.1 oligosaccharide flippase family protein [Levilactobacillus namurensis]